MKNRILSIIAAVLVVLSLATLFLDGVSLSPEVMSQMGDVIGEYGTLLSQSGQDVNIDDLARAYGLSTADFTSAFDAEKSLDAMKQTANMFTSGGISMMEMRGLLAGAASLAKSYIALAAMTGQSAEEYKYVGTANIAYTAFIVLLFLLGAWALYGVFRQRKARGIPLTVFMLLILLADVVIVFAMNESISSSGASIEAVAVTPWAILGFVLSLASVVLCFMAAKGPKAAIQAAGNFADVSPDPRPSRTAGTTRAPAQSAAAEWICPQCGSRVSADDMFCGACGTPKPAAPVPQKKICPTCGAELAEDAAFCPQCGARVTADAQPANGAYQPQGYAQPAEAAYPPQQAYAQPANDVYQPQQAYAQPAEKTFQPAVDPWIQQSAPQAAPAGSGTVHTVLTNEPAPLNITFEIDQQTTGLHETKTLPLTTSLLVGRKSHCNLMIEDSTVSTTHLRINRAGDNVFVSDMNSTNGTKLNGASLQGEAPLNSGDTLEIGHTLLTVRF